MDQSRVEIRYTHQWRAINTPRHYRNDSDEVSCNKHSVTRGGAAAAGETGYNYKHVLKIIRRVMHAKKMRISGFM